MKLKILFVSSEVYPFSKTGGLADVSYGLPVALKQLGHDVKIITPAYKSVTEKLKDMRMRLKKHDFTGFRVLQGSIPKTGTPVYFLDMPELYYRNGGPYGTELGIDWPDNADRFDALTDVAVDMAMDALGLDWKADIVHCNDWQTGLIPAKLSLVKQRPATIFTIHNMAYLGLFSKTVFNHLNLPAEWWSLDHLEFHDQLSFLKAGILHADQINTVSPTYAEQIRTHEFGYGMEGMLNHRGDRLTGILNGIDYKEWNPEKDPHISTPYNVNNLELKQENKLALQKEAGLPQSGDTPLFGMIGRMVEQKGFDLVEQIIPTLMSRNVQFIILGSGEKALENRFLALQAEYPEKISVTIEYNESFAHRIEAGVDIFLMPSRFEPCGLNQFYSLRYGTVPIVHHTGGLADSVIDTTKESLADGIANGFKLYSPDTHQLLESINKALSHYEDKDTWRNIQQNGMNNDVSWLHSAQNYVDTYLKAIECQEGTNPK